MAIGIGVTVLGFSRLKTIRHQFPLSDAQQPAASETRSGKL